FTLTPTTPTNNNSSSSIIRVSNLIKSPLSDETIWNRLREAGFDEESIKRRDKGSLIAHIAKLEAEIYSLQNQMGILIIEKKEWVANYEEMKSNADSFELALKRDYAAHVASLAEAKKREEGLKKALGIEKECVFNIEKALHEMRSECAEAKVAADIKLAEARSMMEDGLKKMTEANAKMQAAEALEADASRSRRAAERKLHEVEAREDNLRRQMNSFKSEYVFNFLLIT
nr:protein crowded nucleiI 4 [Tanacetum cinerariifolium]